MLTAMDIHIFVAENDEHIGNAIKAFLLDAGYNVELCAEKFQKVQRRFCNNDRRALSGDSNELRAFDNMADDFIAKPFSMQILLKRVEALLRRSGALQKEVRFGFLAGYSIACPSKP